MTAQDLKNSILQLAVQGKLVPQCKEDEPASELLKRISAEKAKLGIKEKPLPEITDDEIPFDIPENWKWVRLNTISSITSGGTPARTNSTFWNGNIPWVKIGDIKDKYVLSTEEKITEQGLNSCSAKIFPQKTILYTIFATIGTVGILGIEAATNQAVAGITIYGEYDLDYMYYVLVGLKDILVSKGKGMAQMNINQSILKNTPIPIPPLAEQKRIVAKIEELLPMVEEYGKAQEQLATLNDEFPDKLRKSILQQAVQGKLTERDPSDEPASELLKRIKAEKENLIKSGKIKKEKPLPAITDDEKPFDIPDTWEWTRLGTISSKITDGEHKTPRRVENFCGYYLLSARNIRDGYLSIDNVDFVDSDEYAIISKRCNPKINDVLISCSGSVGRCCVINDNAHYVMVRSAAMVSPVIINSRYLMYAIRSTSVQQQVQDRIKQSAQPNLFQGAIVELAIPLPPLSEQKRIVKRVDELLALCEGLK